MTWRLARTVGPVLALGVLTSGCERLSGPRAASTARYVVGGSYQADGMWYYPREDFQYDATGLASVLPDRRGQGSNRETANGEVADDASMSAAHQTLQLPSIARVTNLESGSQVVVRINDRGPAAPSRVIALSRRAAALLGIRPGGAAQVRVQVEEAPSLALRERLQPGPRLVARGAPRDGVVAETLAPPPGIRQSIRVRTAGTTPVRMTTPLPEEGISDPLPATARQVPARPGLLVIEAGSFGRFDEAHRVEARLSGLPARVERVREGCCERYQVRAGPYDSVAAADAALDRALRAGVLDARIVVE